MRNRTRSITACQVCELNSFDYVIMSRKPGRSPKVKRICRQCVLGNDGKYGYWVVLAVRSGPASSAFRRAYLDSIQEARLYDVRTNNV